MKRYDYMITGCGLSGLMLAYRMSMDSYFNQSSILLLDSEIKNSDDRTWSFWEEGEGEWDHLLTAQWDKVQLRDAKFEKQFQIAPYIYKTIRSGDFYQFVWDQIHSKENITFIQDEVLNISHRSEFASILGKKGEYVAKKLFNSILFDKRYNQQPKYPVLKQHFIGWFIETKVDAFDADVVTFMDFSVDQKKKTRFMYVLPFAKNSALIEYTLFSDRLLPKYEYEEEIKTYLKRKGIVDYKIKEVEQGSIPMTSYRFWRQNSSHVLYIGTAGGWTKASTGYTFSTTQKKTKDLIEFLKVENQLKKFRKKSRFWFYDLLFLDVLSKKNEMGSKLFIKLFKRNHTTSILQFLDEETSFFQELKIMLSMPPLHFVIALFKRIRG